MSKFLSHPQGKGYYGIFNDSYPPIIDGVTLTVENYVKEFVARQLNTCVVTPWNPEIIDVGCDVMRFFSLPIRSRHPYRYGYPKLDPFIWPRLLKTDFRILHAHCPFSSGRLAVYVKRHKGVPLIGTFHSKYREDLKHSFRHTPWFVPIIMRRILDFFNACDEVWIPQAQVEETVREYGYKGKLTVVENGNDFDGLITGSLEEHRAAARKRTGIPEDKFALLFVGQHIREKGVDLILRALEGIGNKVDFIMNFIGTGYAAGEMEDFIKSHGLEDKVFLRGVITDRMHLSDYFAGSDLFVFPSLYDNAPLVVRESAAMGTPSLLAEGSTASEVITDGFNGYLTGHSVATLAESIVSLSSRGDELHQTGLRARNTLVRDWNDVVGEVLDRYNVLIKSRSLNK